jgi:hypothetical protein
MLHSEPFSGRCELLKLLTRDEEAFVQRYDQREAGLLARLSDLFAHGVLPGLGHPHFRVTALFQGFEEPLSQAGGRRSFRQLLVLNGEALLPELVSKVPHGTQEKRCSGLVRRYFTALGVHLGHPDGVSLSVQLAQGPRVSVQLVPQNNDEARRRAHENFFT